ncbi:hypothetical protein [Sphingopyxis sp.]|uniref:hypothetical protein n=1 Tax=Sphingopyxis sp. TaxID=1908224 RepID=UPI002ED871B9
MDLINLLLVPLLGLAGYYAFASGLAYVRARKWVNGVFAMTAATLLAGCGSYLIARAMIL